LLSKSGGMAHSPSIRFSAPRTATRSWARAVGVMATLVVAGCSEDAEPCNKCSWTDVFFEGDCPVTDGLILYEIVIDDTLHTLVCGRGPTEELTPLDYDRVVNCDGAGLGITVDVDSVRVRVRTFDDTCSSNGWQTVATEIPTECGCQVRTIRVRGSRGAGAADADTPQPDLGGGDAGR
jgi:hypothetical protein